MREFENPGEIIARAEADARSFPIDIPTELEGSRDYWQSFFPTLNKRPEVQRRLSDGEFQAAMLELQNIYRGISEGVKIDQGRLGEVLEKLKNRWQEVN